MHELFSETLKHYVRGWIGYQPDSDQSAAPLTFAAVRPRISSVGSLGGRCGFSNRVPALGSVTNERVGCGRNAVAY